MPIIESMHGICMDGGWQATLTAKADQAVIPPMVQPIITSPVVSERVIDPSVLSIMARHGLEVPADGKPLSMRDVDAAIAGQSISQRMHIKGALSHAGLL